MELSCFLVVCIFLNVLRVSSTPAQLLASYTTNNVLTPLSPRNNTSALPASINSTQLSDLPNVVCSDHFGSNLVLASCQNALSKITYDDNPLTFGMRDTGNFDVSLPVRYLSDDGRCAIDVLPDGLVLSDAATWHQIALAATLTIEKCIMVQSPTTGGVGYTGAHKGLSVQIKSSDLQVQCAETRFHYKAIPPYASCQILLSEMPWSQQYTIFGPIGQPGVQVGLPESISSEDPRCWLSIYARDSTRPDMRGLRDVERWSVLWAAAVAVNEMCIKQGRYGTAMKLGAEKHLYVTFIGSGSRPPSSLSAQLAQSTEAADVAIA